MWMWLVMTSKHYKAGRPFADDRSTSSRCSSLVSVSVCAFTADSSLPRGGHLCYLCNSLASPIELIQAAPFALLAP